MDYKVSVVIPIYNVEKYLLRCLTSITGQTYYNLEIILVNDGSTDNSGIIAEEYSKTDHRIRVIHQNNCGLSEARNTGVKNITGDFTLFVDSDDWIENNMIEVLLDKSTKYNADIVQSAFYYAYDDHLLYDNRYFDYDSPPLVLDNIKLMKELVINERVKNFAWGKLYKTKIIRNIPFEPGVLFEDVFWAHKIMESVHTYVLVHQPLCFYAQRSDSIVSTYTPKNLDIIKGLKERQLFIEKNYRVLSDESNKVYLKTMFIHYNLLIANRKKDYRGMYKKEIQKEILKNYDAFETAAINDKQLYYQLKLFSIHPYLNILILIIRKILRKLKFISQPARLKRINL